MKTIRAFMARFIGLFNARRRDWEMEQEFESHVAMQMEDNIRSGMSPEEARRLALIKAGGLSSARESYREQRGLQFFETLLQDLRYGARNLRKSPGFTAVAVITLALGIGANTAIFLLTYSILLRSLPVPHPSELIRYTFRKGESDIGLSYPQYQALQKRQGIATGLFAWQSGEATLTRNGHSQKIPVGLTTGSAFPILQLHPALGRGFAPNVGEKGNGWQP